MNIILCINLFEDNKKNHSSTDKVDFLSSEQAEVIIPPPQGNHQVDEKDQY